MTITKGSMLRKIRMKHDFIQFVSGNTTYNNAKSFLQFKISYGADVTQNSP